jgi:hypothetical protein
MVKGALKIILIKQLQQQVPITTGIQKEIA